MDDDAKQAEYLVEAYHRITAELGRFLVGQEQVVEQLMIAILARGHCLLEGVPGLAKTMMVRSLSQVMHLSFRRIQFTPDLMPADITGTEIIQEDPTTGSRELSFQPGPHLRQHDPGGRDQPHAAEDAGGAAGGHAGAPGDGRRQDLSRCRSRSSCWRRRTRSSRKAPIPLPEAQLDRFMFHVKVAYPTREQEREIMRRTTSGFEVELNKVIAGERSSIAAGGAQGPGARPRDGLCAGPGPLLPAGRARSPSSVKDLIEWGAGPRACQMLILGAKVRALLHGRLHARSRISRPWRIPVLRHRLVPTFNAEADGVSVDDHRGPRTPGRCRAARSRRSKELMIADFGLRIGVERWTANPQSCNPQYPNRGTSPWPVFPNY